jgi:TIR domain/PDZ domain
MAGKIFINYRRDDSPGTAGRLHDRLAQTFGRTSLFMDVDHIPAGVDFTEYLHIQVAACDVFLAVIGPNWLDAKDDSGRRRFDNPDDFVTIEIAAALARNIRVIPVLVDGARTPKADKLPDSIRPLVRRNAVEVRNTNFGRDAEALANKVGEALKGARPATGRWPFLASGAAWLMVPGRWRTVAGTAMALLLVGWIGLYQVGAPVWVPWAPDPPDKAKAVADAEAQRKAIEAELQRLKDEVERQAKAAADAEAKRRAAEAEQQRFKEEQQRQAQAAADAEAKRKAAEVEQQRLAAVKAEEERKAKAAAEAEAKRKAEEAEKERLAASKAEEDRKAKAAAEAEAKRKATEAEQQRLAVVNSEEAHSRAWFGVRIQLVTDQIAESVKISPPRGALVAGVDGPAKLAGIEPGDVIVKFDGKDIKEMRELPRLIADTPVGKQTPVVIIRKGKEETKTVTLGRLEDKPVVKKTLGLELANMSDDLRKRYKIKDTVKGVVITGIDANSSGADKRLAPGDVIVEIAQEAVASADDLRAKIDKLKNDGRKSALLLVARADGELRFFALSLYEGAAEGR